ncbi:MAG: NAD(P)-dependent oxidoreductase [Cyanobacteria bacterium REEB67]|nr:NAD(P)-dependent oxidoreductase [Cyanobacteria bacterium REEB67]
MSTSGAPMLADYYLGKNILITGAGGFIGGHLTAYLAGLGAAVDATVHTAAGDDKMLTGAKIRRLRLDVSDLGAIKDLLSERRYDLIFHLAARPAGDRGQEQMTEQARVTLGGTVNLATAVLAAISSKQSAPLVVHLGSSEEYGAANTPFFENQALAPVSPYSAAKASASQFLLMARTSFGLPVIVARPSVVFGPGQKSGMVIPYLFDCYSRKKAAEISPGEQTRDFLYIDDCVDGLARLGSRAELAGECFNLGCGEEVKLKDVAEEIARLCGYEGDLGLGSRPYRCPEVMRHRQSVAKALDKLDWRAVVDLKEGLQRTHQWWQSRRPSESA